MPGKHQVRSLFLQTLTHVATATLPIAIIVLLAAIPAWVQNTVPSTAREAAVSPAFASRLANPVTPKAAGKARAPAHPRPGRPSPQDRVIYENGPVNGTTDAWTIDFGFVVSDTLTLSNAATVTGFDFYAWEFPHDSLSSVQWSITSSPNGGTVYGSGTVSGSNLTDTFLSTNQFGYDIDKITATGLNVTLNNGTFWFNLFNASVPSGDPIYWDENSGVGCQSTGCPSQAVDSGVGTIPSESFDIVGGGSGCSYDRPALPKSMPTLHASTVTSPASPSLTYQVIHDFTGAEDGAGPQAGPTIDHAGNLYGTAAGGGQNGDGIVYKMSRRGSDWTFSTLYSFKGGNDGLAPYSGLTIDTNGALNGTTTYGGGSGCGYGLGCGTVFAVRPSPHATYDVMGGWMDTVLYSFTGGSDGAHLQSDLIFDPAGNIYGVTDTGGYGKGGVYELVPVPGGWAFRLIYSFTGAADGAYPISDLMFDQYGNLYGAAYTGGYVDCGTIYELTPSGGGWIEKTLYTFRGQEDSGNPLGLVIDQAGNLYGVTIGAGCLGGKCDGVGASTVFMLSPQPGAWKYRVLTTYTGLYAARISIDAAGNLYVNVAYPGQVFRLAPSGGTWTYTDLHDFGGSGDGFWPVGHVVVDQNGYIYGVTQQGGAYNGGVVWKIAP